MAADRSPAQTALLPASRGLNSSPSVPAVLERAGDQALFAARISNPHTRRAYARVVRRFLAWCELEVLELSRFSPGCGEGISRTREPSGTSGSGRRAASSARSPSVTTSTAGSGATSRRPGSTRIRRNPPCSGQPWGSRSSSLPGRAAGECAVPGRPRQPHDPGA